MEKTLNKSEISLWVVLGLLTILAGIEAVSRFPNAFGSAPSGLPANLATSSTISVGSSTVVTLFSTDLFCASRIITTQLQPMFISFGSTTPSNIAGHYQAASTTVAYDSGLYGCGQWRAVTQEIKPNESTTTATLSEFK